MATPKQRTRFFMLWAKAQNDVCLDYGLNPYVAADLRLARHRWILEQTRNRTENINAVRNGAEFDRLMLATASAAQDFEAAAYWSMAVAKRWRHMLSHLVRQLGEITCQPRPWEYVQAIFAHLRLPASWEDVPEAELESVWQMLDTHRRRLLKRDHGWQGLRMSDRDPLGFFESISYVHSADGELGLRWIGADRPGGDAESADVFTEELERRPKTRVYGEVAHA